MKISKITLAALLGVVCAACGSGQDFSGSNELSKAQAKPATATTPSGGVPQSHKGMMIPNIPPPPAKGG